MKRRPSTWTADLVGPTVPATAKHQPRPPIAGDLRPRVQQPPRAIATSRRSSDNERLHVRLRPMHECRPAREPMLTRDHQLRAGKTDRQIAQPIQRHRIPASCPADELLGLLSKLLEIHIDLLPRGLVSAASRKKTNHRADKASEGGHSPSRGPEAPFNATATLHRDNSKGGPSRMTLTRPSDRGTHRSLDPCCVHSLSTTGLRSPMTAELVGGFGLTRLEP